MRLFLQLSVGLLQLLLLGAEKFLGLAQGGCLLLQALGTWITIRGLQDEYRSIVTGAVILISVSATTYSGRLGKQASAAP